MDIALSGLIILIVLLPGICFNRGYFSGVFSYEYTKNNFFSLLISAFIPSVILYLTFYILLLLFTGYDYNFIVFLGLFSSDRNIYFYSIAMIEKYKAEIILLNLVINLVSFFLGFYVKNLVVRYKLDTKYSFLRYKNYWYYLITGKFIDFPSSSIKLYKNTVNDVDITYIDALVSINDITYIYTGILVDYNLGKEGTLDLLLIKDAQRKKVNGKNNGEYKDIDGHIIALKYCDLINVNFSFIQVLYNEEILESSRDETEQTIRFKLIE